MPSENASVAPPVSLDTNIICDVDADAVGTAATVYDGNVNSDALISSPLNPPKSKSAELDAVINPKSSLTVAEAVIKAKLLSSVPANSEALAALPAVPPEIFKCFSHVVKCEST